MKRLLQSFPDMKKYGFNPEECEGLRELVDERVVYRGKYDEDISGELVIPEGIEEIAENAFRGFGSLARVVLPKSLKRISACAFSGCTSLREVVIPDGVLELLDEAFAFCPALTEIHLPDSVRRIGGSAFEG